jgi:parvulin-like peptidyl-prolyl isomerase
MNMKQIAFTETLSRRQLNRTKLKKQISTRENVPAAFADAAAEHSSCPSGRKGNFYHRIDGIKKTTTFSSCVTCLNFALFLISPSLILLTYCDLITGGSLGSFGPRQMVPEFDKVVFNEAVGVIHGPIKTQFGAHLILIESRDD